MSGSAPSAHAGRARCRYFLMSCRAGELRGQTLMGTTALYRVVDMDQTHARMEVVRSPGLPRGACFRIGLVAVHAMELVENSSETVGDPVNPTIVRSAA